MTEVESRSRKQTGRTKFLMNIIQVTRGKLTWVRYLCSHQMVGIKRINVLLWYSLTQDISMYYGKIIHLQRIPLSIPTSKPLSTLMDAQKRVFMPVTKCWTLTAEKYMFLLAFYNSICGIAPIIIISRQNSKNIIGENQRYTY